MKELNVEANLESRIAKLTTEEDFPKHKKQTLLLSEMLIVSCYKGLWRPSISVGKMSNIRRQIHLRWLV